MSTDEYYSEETGEIIATDASDNASLRHAIQKAHALPVDPANWRPAGIVNFEIRLPSGGRIKIGGKGESRQSKSGGSYQMPVKYDHFVVTTLDRGTDGNFRRDTEIMAMLGDSPKNIPVVLIYDDINLNLQTRYAMYEGKTLKCTGDGLQARWNDSEGPRMVQCPCPRQNPAYLGTDKCKVNGTLSVIIQGADVVGSTWKLRTTSYNSVTGLLASMSLIKRVSGGVLAGIPLTLTLSPKSVADPISGKQKTIYVVGIEYRGSFGSLQEIGYSTMLRNKQHGVRVEQLEQQARFLIAKEADEYESDSDDIVSEFYPEQQEGYQQEAQTTQNRPRTFAHLGGKSNESKPQSQPQQPAKPQVIQDVPAKQQRPVIEHGAEPDFDLF